MDKEKNIAALFDLDGVVLDTETQYTVFWDKVGKDYFPQYENFGHLIKGQTLKRIYEKYFKGMEAVQASVSADLDRFEREMRYEYIPGVVDFMKELRRHDVKIAIVTSSDKKKLANVHAAHPELAGLVDRILMSEMFPRSKPAPDCFLMGAEVFDTVPENCVVFEDSFHGLEAGNAANMAVVGLCTTNPEEAIRDKARVVIPDFSTFTYEDMMKLL